MSEQQSNLQQQQSSQLQTQLQKIDNLTKSIEQMKKQLNSLMKQEQNHVKKIQHKYHQSLRAVQTKINKVSAQQQKLAVQKMRSTRRQNLHSHAKILRDQSLQQLRSAREQLMKNKNDERAILKQISIKNEARIRKQKEAQLQRKRKICQNAKKMKQTFNFTMQQSRIQEMQEKEQMKLKKNLQKLQQQPYLVKQIRELQEKKRQLEQNIEEKKNVENKLQSAFNNLSGLSNDQVIKIVKEVTRRSANYSSLGKKDLNQGFFQEILKKSNVVQKNVKVQKKNTESTSMHSNRSPKLAPVSQIVNYNNIQRSSKQENKLKMKSIKHLARQNQYQIQIIP